MKQNSRDQNPLGASLTMHQPGPVRSLFWWMAGIDWRLAGTEEHRPYWRVYDAWGFLVCSTGAMAFVSGYHLGVMAWRGFVPAVLMGVFLASLITAIDRAIISALWGHQFSTNRGRNLLLARVAGSVASGAIFVTLMMLSMFRLEITQVIPGIIAERVHQQSQVIALELDPQTRQAQADLVAVQADIKQARRSADSSQAEANLELDGRGGTLTRGDGKVWAQKAEQARDQALEAAHTRLELQPRVIAATELLDSLKAEKRKRIQAAETAAKLGVDGPLMQFTALWELIRVSWPARVWIMMLAGTLLFYELAPILLKYQHPVTTYDRLISEWRVRDRIARKVRLRTLQIRGKGRITREEADARFEAAVLEVEAARYRREEMVDSEEAALKSRRKRSQPSGKSKSGRAHREEYREARVRQAMGERARPDIHIA